MKFVVGIWIQMGRHSPGAGIDTGDANTETLSGELRQSIKSQCQTDIQRLYPGYRWEALYVTSLNRQPAVVLRGENWKHIVIITYQRRR